MAIGSRCTPVISAEKPSSFWKYSASQKAKIGKQKNPQQRMIKSYEGVSRCLYIPAHERTSEKSRSFQIFISIIAYGYLISQTTKAIINRAPSINSTRT